jgi:hypothetical protein
MEEALSIQERLAGLEDGLRQLHLQVDQLVNPTGKWLAKIRSALCEPDDFQAFLQACARIRKDLKLSDTGQPSAPGEAQSLEQRMIALERQVARLKLYLDQLVDPKGNWLKHVVGSMKDNLAFPEAMRLAAEIRRADRPADEE